MDNFGAEMKTCLSLIVYLASIKSDKLILSEKRLSTFVIGLGQAFAAKFCLAELSSVGVIGSAVSLVSDTFDFLAFARGLYHKTFYSCIKDYLPRLYKVYQ